jgi:hypothetical protein
LDIRRAAKEPAVDGSGARRPEFRAFEAIALARALA